MPRSDIICFLCCYVDWTWSTVYWNGVYPADWSNRERKTKTTRYYKLLTQIDLIYYSRFTGREWKFKLNCIAAIHATVVSSLKFACRHFFLFIIKWVNVLMYSVYSYTLPQLSKSRLRETLSNPMLKWNIWIRNWRHRTGQIGSSASQTPSALRL